MARAIYSIFLTLTLVFSFFATAVQASQKEISFVHGGLEYEMQRLESDIKRTYPAKDTTTRKEWISKARKAAGEQNYHEAIRAYRNALAVNGNDIKTLVALSKVYLAAKTRNSSERYYFPQRASAAAYKAYKLSKTAEDKATALFQAAAAMERRSYWRPAINAYKASLSNKEDATVRKAYKQLRAQHGFRVMDYKVDSETETPRACIQFSEVLSKARVDFAKFIQVDGKEPAGVVREDKQLCVDGLRHGQKYVVKVREGLPSSIGEKILKTSDLVIYVRDRQPMVRFSGNGYVLPKTGQNGLPLVSTNTSKVKIEIYRVGDRALNKTLLDGYIKRNFNRYAINNLKNNLAAKVWAGEMDIKSRLNKDVTTALPVTKAVKDMKPGLYVAYATPVSKAKDSGTVRASQWFVVSDLGLTSMSGKEGLHAFVRSLSTADPLKDVKVRLVARNNEVLGTGKTDENGHVKFDKGLANGAGALSPHLIVAEREEGDYAFLDVTNSSFDLTDRGVKGRTPPGALDAYMFTERGVYRTGEEVYLTAMLRNKAGKAVPQVPLTLIIRRPDGVEHKRVPMPDEGDGGRSFILSLPANGMSGNWKASVYTDPKESPIGFVSFLVEDYTPQRMELTLNSKQEKVEANKPLTIDAEGRYLYGAPASNMAMNGEVLVRQKSSGLDAYKGYRFGVFDEKFLNVNKQLSNLGKTNAEGKASLKIDMPEIPVTGKVLEAQFTVRITEPGGRSLTKQMSLDVKPQKTLLGIKPLFSGSVGEGQTASFDVVTVDPDGKQTEAKGLSWELLRIENRYQWYNHNGSWNYRTVSYTRKVADGTIDTKADGAVRISKALDWGTYRLDISSADANGPRGSYRFYSGWYGSAQADTPDKLDLVLDKDHYKSGDTMTVSLSPKSNGKALVAVVDDKVLAVKAVDVSKAGSKVDFTVGKDWGAGAYVTAIFYRPMDEKAKRMPTRSIGMAWVKPDVSENTLKISMDVPEKVRPNGKFEVPVTLADLKEGAEARVVISAVDVGILNLTRHAAPKPDQYYYGQRLLGAEIRDLYGKLIDGMQAAAGKIRSGGGAMGGFGAPPASSVVPVALYSGIVKVGKDGKALITFDMPAFDGTVRLMAVAWNADQLGSAQKDVIVRDPVVVIGTAPHFLTSGDISNLHFSLDNVEGPEGEFTYTLSGSGAVSVDEKTKESKVALKQKERKQFSVPLTAKGYGAAKLELAIAGPDGFSLKREYNFAVYAAAPNVTRRVVHKLSKDGGKLVVSKADIKGLIDGSVKVSVNVNKGLALDVPGLLLSLDRYPYGCTEQTTSRALPLLYYSKIAEQNGMAGDKGAKERIAKAITRISGMQSSNGAFGLWSAYSGDIWLTAYVADFLTRAKAEGYPVADLTFNQAMDRLQNAVNYVSDFKSGGEDVAYALYVLARNGRAGIGDLRYFVDAKLDNFATPLSQAQLGAALAMYGDKERAQQAFKASEKSLKNILFETSYRRDYGSAVRDAAALLTLVSEAKTSGLDLSSVTALLEKARTGKNYTSTQENAWLLMAANALQDDSKSLKLAVNGVPHTGALKNVLKSSQLKEGDFTIVNRNAEEIQASVTVTGAGENPEPAASSGFRITREAYSLDGKPVKLENVKQNERFVIVLKVEELEAKKGRVILVDRIPAGFEIENPKLVHGSDIKALPWLKYSTKIEHSQFKDDKFVAAFNMALGYRKNKPATMTTAYIVRAVAPGTYLHPAAVIEDMYRPDRFGRTEAGKVVISGK